MEKEAPDMALKDRVISAGAGEGDPPGGEGAVRKQRRSPGSWGCWGGPGGREAGPVLVGRGLAWTLCALGNHRGD